MTDMNERLAAIPSKSLKDLIARMRTATDLSKAPYTLPQLLAEEHRRLKVGAFPTIETAKVVIDQAGRSSTGVTTYKAVWDAFRPGEPWKANASAREVTNALDRVSFYCIRHGLPLIPTLVVNSASGDLTDEARSNIYNAARERGVSVGPDRNAFVFEQQRLSQQLSRDADHIWPAADEHG